MNKKIIIPMFALALIGIVSALIIIDNGYLLDRDEMSGVTDNQIANYMTNAFQIESYKVMENKIIIKYNITYVEPTSYFNNETNTTESRYKVFTQPKPFIIDKSLWNECLNKTTTANCVNILVHNEEPFVYDDGESNRTITSTYYKAKQEQLKQYERAKGIRDNAISNDLDELFNRL